MSNKCCKNCKHLRKVKYGEWIEHEDKLGMIDDLMCSLCGHCTYEDYPNFCSNCGADMRGKESLTDEINELIGEGFVI